MIENNTNTNTNTETNTNNNTNIYSWDYSKLLKYSVIPNGLKDEIQSRVSYSIGKKDLNYKCFFNGWEFFNVDDILNRKDEWENLKFIDLGTNYHGMGHFIVVSIIKETGDFFFRMDGGSNDYDRILNMYKFKNYNPLSKPTQNFNLEQMKEKLNSDLVNASHSIDIYHIGIEKDGIDGLNKEIEKMNK